MITDRYKAYYKWAEEGEDGTARIYRIIKMRSS